MSKEFTVMIETIIYFEANEEIMEDYGMSSPFNSNIIEKACGCIIDTELQEVISPCDRIEHDN
jgi:hypothetical protein